MPATRSQPAQHSSIRCNPISPGASRNMTSKRTADKRHIKGDFTVISCNHVSFQVPRFYMLAASSVIRDMYELGTADDSFELELDSTNETADTVRLWLDIVVGDSPPDLDLSTIRRLHKVLALCQNFDCPTISRTIFFALRAKLDDPESSPFEISALDAAFGSDSVVEHAVRQEGTWNWSKEAEGHFAALQHIKGGLVRNPLSWSYDDFIRYPSGYCWALLRSRLDTKTPAEQADKLKVLLALLKERAGAVKSTSSK